MNNQESDEAIVQLSAYSGWIVGVSYSQDVAGYRCWIVDPELNLLSDGQVYEVSYSAMMMGRAFIDYHSQQWN